MNYEYLDIPHVASPQLLEKWFLTNHPEVKLKGIHNLSITESFYLRQEDGGTVEKIEFKVKALFCHYNGTEFRIYDGAAVNNTGRMQLLKIELNKDFILNLQKVLSRGLATIEKKIMTPVITPSRVDLENLQQSTGFVWRLSKSETESWIMIGVGQDLIEIEIRSFWTAGNFNLVKVFISTPEVILKQMDAQKWIVSENVDSRIQETLNWLSTHYPT